MVNAVNAALCQAKRALHRPASDGYEPARKLWEQPHRQALWLDEAVFAGLLNVPKVTAISWEKGRRRPTGAALRLIDLIRKKPQILQEAW